MVGSELRRRGVGTGWLVPDISLLVASSRGVCGCRMTDNYNTTDLSTVGPLCTPHPVQFDFSGGSTVSCILVTIRLLFCKLGNLISCTM